MGVSPGKLPDKTVDDAMYEVNIAMNGYYHKCVDRKAFQCGHQGPIMFYDGAWKLSPTDSVRDWCHMVASHNLEPPSGAWGFREGHCNALCIVSKHNSRVYHVHIDLDGIYVSSGQMNGRDKFVNLNGPIIFFDVVWKLSPFDSVSDWCLWIDSNALQPPIGKWQPREGFADVGCSLSKPRHAIGNRLGSGGTAQAARATGGISSRSSRTRGNAAVDWKDFEKSYFELTGRLGSRQRSSMDIYSVKRGQDQLSAKDFAKLHGYLILGLSDSTRTKHSFMRIDWTDAGFEVDELDDYNFPSYMDQHRDAASEGAEQVDKMCYGVGTAAAGLIVYSACTFNPVGVVAVVGYGTMAATAVVVETRQSAEEAFRNEAFVVTNHSGKRNGVLADLLVLLEEYLQQKKQYCLSSWNCNHVANALFERLLLPGTDAELHTKDEGKV